MIAVVDWIDDGHFQTLVQQTLKSLAGFDNSKSQNNDGKRLKFIETQEQRNKL